MRICGLLVIVLWGSGAVAIKTIAIIGGGLNGMTCAIQLANLKDAEENPLFRVHVYESNSTVLSRDSASALSVHLHLGGEYPASLESAFDCLRGALLFTQMFQEVYTPAKGTFFGIRLESPIPLDEFMQHYNHIHFQYTQYYPLL